MAAGAAATAAAAATRNRIVATAAWGVIELEPDQFLLALALEAEPLVVRSAVTSFWANNHRYYRYLAAVKGGADILRIGPGAGATRRSDSDRGEKDQDSV
jgi:hypothetical protein